MWISAVSGKGGRAFGNDLIPFIRRHHCGDWGDLCADDKETNNLALTTDERILSKYHVVAAVGTRVSIYIITEWDRRLTTILLKEKY